LCGTRRVPIILRVNLNTDHLKRYIDTLRSSLELYGQAAAGSINQEIFRNAIVKGYELAQETSFKLIKKSLREYGHGAKKLDSTPVKDLLRLAATHGLMTIEEVERWFAYRDNRNNTAHDYGENFAKETLRLIPGFIEDVSRLEAVLRKLYSDGGN
jgi:nucleotidyltransferase substrate binding protein (TIGR01987 family)